MELDSLFTEQKWQILQRLGIEKLSPLQLAEKTSTTISNVSQQLKLLEAANIVKKQKIPNRDRGKPRALFSLTNNFAYIVTISNGFVEKRLFPLEEPKKALLRIWFLENDEIKDSLEKIHRKLLVNFDKLQFMAVNTARKELIIVGTGISREWAARLNSYPPVNVRILSKTDAENYVFESGSSNEEIRVLLDRLQ